MWIKPDYQGSLEELVQEYQLAMYQLEKDRATGNLVSVDDSDVSTWL